MKRFVFNALVMISVLLCLATIMLWVRSYSVAEHLTWRVATEQPGWFRGRVYNISSGKGGCGLSYSWGYENGDAITTMTKFEPGFRFEQYRPAWSPSNRIDGPGFDFDHFGFVFDRNILDFVIAKSRYFQGYTSLGAKYQIVIPFWVLTCMALFMPAIYMTKRLRSSRRALSGCCNACGYDLRATPDRCPECGMECNCREANAEKR